MLLHKSPALSIENEMEREDEKGTPTGIGLRQWRWSCDGDAYH